MADGEVFAPPTWPSALDGGVAPDMLATIAQAHGFPGVPVRALDGPGITNRVYAIGARAVLRVPRRPEYIPDLAREALVAPLAYAAGVRTPRVLAFDDSCRLVPVPYLVTELVAGDNLGLADSAGADDVYRELGRDLARWHRRTAPEPDPLATLPRHGTGDPRPVLAKLADGGYLGRDVASSRGTAHWLARWFDKLESAGARDRTPPRVVHGDASPTNLLVDSTTGSYRALLDWGDTGWADPATEFAKLPLTVLPHVLAGYRESGGTVGEAQVLWHYLSWALPGLKARPYEATKWAAQPQSRLIDIMRFFLDPTSPGHTDPRWRALAP